MSHLNTQKLKYNNDNTTFIKENVFDDNTTFIKENEIIKINRLNNQKIYELPVELFVLITQYMGIELFEMKLLNKYLLDKIKKYISNYLQLSLCGIPLIRGVRSIPFHNGYYIPLSEKETFDCKNSHDTKNIMKLNHELLLDNVHNFVNVIFCDLNNFLLFINLIIDFYKITGNKQLFFFENTELLFMGTIGNRAYFPLQIDTKIKDNTVLDVGFNIFRNIKKLMLYEMVISPKLAKVICGLKNLKYLKFENCIVINCIFKNINVEKLSLINNYYIDFYKRLYNKHISDNFDEISRLIEDDCFKLLKDKYSCYKIPNENLSLAKIETLEFLSDRHNISSIINYLPNTLKNIETDNLFSYYDFPRIISRKSKFIDSSNCLYLTEAYIKVYHDKNYSYGKQLSSSVIKKNRKDIAKCLGLYVSRNNGFNKIAYINKCISNIHLMLSNEKLKNLKILTSEMCFHLSLTGFNFQFKIYYSINQKSFIDFFESPVIPTLSHIKSIRLINDLTDEDMGKKSIFIDDKIWIFNYFQKLINVENVDVDCDIITFNDLSNFPSLKNLTFHSKNRVITLSQVKMLKMLKKIWVGSNKLTVKAQTYLKSKNIIFEH